ncbi:MAG TPA: hypothetical protein PLO14_07945 [Accumulibacter sp.]|uniref:hypothetical protein n=1 Tax=Accumulibacter sp. TaxID=2053492 RepID=UPI0025F3E858|nr:hypothetical protein [Accumulibacter sp.]MCM8599100.1 hypothetical protein [Accumulibacter sp.]MCM8662402.1 hypothetical protein [Accumulibacter sp.]HNC52153.1 hypothetical protein [Accumulibacter sp.]
MTGEQNLRLIREIEANREFLLLAYSQNAGLLAGAEQRIKELFEPLPTISPRHSRGRTSTPTRIDSSQATDSASNVPEND